MINESPMQLASVMPRYIEFGRNQVSQMRNLKNGLVWAPFGFGAAEIR
jgi:hypothetical protein